MSFSLWLVEPLSSLCCTKSLKISFKQDHGPFKGFSSAIHFPSMCLDLMDGIEYRDRNEKNKRLYFLLCLGYSKSSVTVFFFETCFFNGSYLCLLHVNKFDKSMNLFHGESWHQSREFKEILWKEWFQNYSCWSE